MCHVLIIEDEVIVAEDIRGILEASGATSFAFADTERGAVEEARLHRPEFMTSDVVLAEGDGPRAVAAIHREHGDIPVIYLTSSPESCHGCPPEHVLAKPLQEANILRLFHELAPI